MTPLDHGRLVELVVERLRAEVPLYHDLPSELMHGEVTAAIRENVALLDGVLDSGRVPPTSSLAPLADSAAARADEGVPLGNLLEAYFTGAAAIWREIARDRHGVVAAEEMALLVQHLGAVCVTLANSYVPEQMWLSGERDRAQRERLRALVEGDAPDGESPAWYVVARVALATLPEERGDGQPARIATRRKIGRVAATVRDWSPDGALLDLGCDGGIVLLPVESREAEAANAATAYRRAELLYHKVAEAAGVAVHLSVAGARVSGVPAAASTTADVLRAVLASGKPAGVYGIDDVLVEVQLTAPGPARERMLELLAPLDGDLELMRTVVEYVGSGLDRRATAATLGVHPNTVLYRVRKATRLTGLDPAVPGDLLRLSAAVLARRVTGAGGASED